MQEEMKRLSQEVQAMLETVEILQDAELIEALQLHLEKGMASST